MKGLASGLEKLIKSICTVLLVLVVLMAFVQRSGIILALAISFFATYFFYRFDISHKRFLIILIVVSSLIRIGVAVGLHNPQLSDFGTLYDISEQLEAGQLHKAGQHYLNVFNYQAPFVIYQSFLLRLFHSLVVLKLMNVLVSVLGLILMYRIINRIAGKKGAQVFTLLYSVFINTILFNNVLSNQHLFSFLILLSFDILGNEKILKNVYLKIMVCALIMGFANLIRPEAVLSVLTFLAFFVYLFIKEEISIRDFIVRALILVVVYLVVSKVPIWGLRQVGFIENESINDNLFKFVLGLDIDHNGRWSEEKYAKCFSFTDKKELRAFEIQEIKNGLFDIRVFRLFLIKIFGFWNDFDFSWSVGYLCKNAGVFDNKYGYFYDFINLYDMTIWVIVLLLAIYGLIRSENDKGRIFSILLIGVFITYLFIEIQGRYAFPYRLYVFILAAIGLDKFVENMRKRNYFNILKLNRFENKKILDKKKKVEYYWSNNLKE